jgi:hypothetical protein
MGRRIEAPDSPRLAHYVGNLLHRGAFPRSPGVELEFFDWGIRLQVKTLLDHPGECYEFRYEELAEVDVVRRAVRRGMRFDASFLPQPLIFLTADYREILERLEQRGVPVRRDVTPLATGPVRRVFAQHPRFRIIFICAAGAFLLIIIGTQVIPTAIGAQENFRTLRSDLAQVHLPSGYRLTAEHRAGTDCAHNGCSLTQTWTWASAAGPTKNRACSAVHQAMTSAYSDIEPDSPIPANAACEYFATVSSFFHASQGKRTIEATVQVSRAHPGNGLAIRLVASYY